MQKKLAMLWVINESMMKLNIYLSWFPRDMKKWLGYSSLNPNRTKIHSTLKEPLKKSSSVEHQIPQNPEKLLIIKRSTYMTMFLLILKETVREIDTEEEKNYNVEQHFTERRRIVFKQEEVK